MDQGLTNSKHITQTTTFVPRLFTETIINHKVQEFYLITFHSKSENFDIRQQFHQDRL